MKDEENEWKTEASSLPLCLVDAILVQIQRSLYDNGIDRVEYPVTASSEAVTSA